MSGTTSPHQEKPEECGQVARKVMEMSSGTGPGAQESFLWLPEPDSVWEEHWTRRQPAMVSNSASATWSRGNATEPLCASVSSSVN